MRSVFDIAGWFITKEPMNIQKLQCLVYLSYAWFYTLNQEDLFVTEGFEALPILPCEMQLFNRYHTYGNKKIKHIAGKKLPKEIAVFLQSVYETYAMADGEGLCSYLRMSIPYQNARSKQSKILREDMKKFYEEQQQY